MYSIYDQSAETINQENISSYYMSNRFEIDGSANQYLKWRSKAQREGFLHKVCLAYYSNNASNLYTINVEGDQRLIPVFVDGDWFQRSSPDVPIVSYNDEEYSDYEEDYLVDLAKAVAYESGKTEGDLDDYIWNNPTYGVTRADRDSLQFNLRLTDYYTVKSKSARLIEEVFKSAYESNLRPDLSYPEIAEELSKLSLPYRDTYFRNFDHMTNFDDGPRLCARSTIVVMNTGDGYAIPFEKRGAEVSESPFWWNPIPGSVFQPLQESNTQPSMKDDTIHAVADKVTPSHDSRRVRSYLFDKIETDEVNLEYTTTGIDCINGYIQFYNLLFIDDTDFYDKFVTHGRSSWHSQDTALIYIQNKDRMKELLDPEVLNPYNILGLSEALIRLRNNYDIDIPLHITRRY